MTTQTPKLRFPEFSDKWEVKKLGEILKIGSGKDYKHLDIGDIPVFGTGGLMTKVDKYLYDGETVCIGRKGTIDKPMYFNGKIWTVDTLFYTHSFKNSTPKFVYNLFLRVNWKLFNEAGGVPSLSKSTIEQIDLSLPSLPEQTKIANFLTAIDEKIQALKQKKTLLEQYKKGIMQQIFSQELRFKNDDGSDFDDWEEKSLGEVLESLPSKKHQIKSTEYNLKGKFKVIDQGKDLIAGYSDSEINVFRNYPVIVFGDHTTVLKYIDFEFIVGADGTKLLKNLNNDDLKFLFYNLSFNNVEQEGYKRHFTILSEVYLQIPSLPEQQKIATFLTAIDEKIEKVSQQIAATETYKKGLLQQMFI
jgi:type I restriction enzyme, S subunit